MATQIAKLEKERDAAFQFAFRKKINRYLADRKQIVIDFGDSPEAVDVAAGIAEAATEAVGGYERRKPATEKPQSEAIPANWPRYEVKLEVVPPKLIVRRTGIPKLALCEGATSGPASSCPWKKSSWTFFHLRHPQKSQGFSGMSAAASSGGHFVHSLLTATQERLRRELAETAAILGGKPAQVRKAREDGGLGDRRGGGSIGEHPSCPLEAHSAQVLKRRAAGAEKGTLDGP